MMNKKLAAWQKATNDLAQEFCNKYFDGTKSWRWEKYDFGSILLIVDHHSFDLNRIVEALEINCTYELLIQFYNYEIECCHDKSLPRYNFKNWVKYFAGFNANI